MMNRKCGFGKDCVEKIAQFETHQNQSKNDEETDKRGKPQSGLNINWILPGHPAELSDSVKLLLTDAKSHVFRIDPVLKSISIDIFSVKISSILVK